MSGAEGISAAFQLAVGDVRDVAAILGGVGEVLDLSAPSCLTVGYLLHFFTADAARDLVASYAAALASGSYVVVSVFQAAKDGAGVKVWVC